MIFTNKDAVYELARINHSGSGVYISGKCEEDLSGVRITDGSTLSFSFDDVLAKKTELQNAEPMRLLRLKRNKFLAQTDWMAGSDVTMSDAWKKYRKDLRDLPSSAKPKLDENGNLTDVTWPTKPE